MSMVKVVSVSILSVCLSIASASVFAGAKTSVENQSRGDITAISDVAGSNNNARVNASAVLVDNENGSVYVKSNNRGDIAAVSVISGSNNNVDVSASAVSVKNGK